MDGEEFLELQSSIAGVRREIKYLKYGCGICLALFIVAWVMLAGVTIAGIVVDNSDPRKLIEITHALVYGLGACALVYTFFQSFSDIVSGNSPFTMKQVFRFRFAAGMLVMLAVVDALLPAGAIYSFNLLGTDLGVMGNEETQLQVNINLMPLFFAAILYGVSVLIRYGTLLQRLADETE